MNYTDHNFPYINYPEGNSNAHWGEIHGEQFRQGIQELAAIRKELMLSKNPALRPKLNELAHEQLEQTRTFAPNLCQEMVGIAHGANLSIADIVILNNYTDFRDIILAEEGCSTIAVRRDQNIYAGQTWDMHGSAKNYLCLIHAPKTQFGPESLILSLVGCVGLMGVNTHRCLVGVNNINTANARVGIIWPVLVRKLLQERSLKSMRDSLLASPVTSGHNYILATSEGAEHWEVTPEVSEKVGSLSDKDSESFHTNHCLGKDVIKLEDKKSLSSTTFNRYKLLQKKCPKIESFQDLKKVLMDHDEFPKSICSHFESGAQDPSFTCGGGISDMTGDEHYFWRGCPVHDKNFVDYLFKLVPSGKHFTFSKHEV